MGQTVNIPGSIEQPHGDKRHPSPKRVQKILHSQDPEPLSETTKIKTDNSPESWQQSIGPWLRMGYNPHFCPAIFWGPPMWLLPSQILRTQNETNQKATAIHARNKTDNKWVPESKFTGHNSKIILLQMFSACQSEFGKERTK